MNSATRCALCDSVRDIIVLDSPAVERPFSVCLDCLTEAVEVQYGWKMTRLLAWYRHTREYRAPKQT